MEGDDVGPSPATLRNGPGPTRPPDPLHIRKNTQKSKFLLSQTLKWKKILLWFKKNFLVTLNKGPILDYVK